MKYKLNGITTLTSEDTIQDIAEKIRDNIIDIGNNNLINWGNVYSVEVLK